MVGAGLVLDGKVCSWMHLYRDDDSLFNSILTSGEGEGALFDIQLNMGLLKKIQFILYIIHIYHFI